MTLERLLNEAAISNRQLSSKEDSLEALTRSVQSLKNPRNEKSGKKKCPIPKIMGVFLLTLVVFIGFAAASIFISLCGKPLVCTHEHGKGVQSGTRSRRLLNSNDNDSLNQVVVFGRNNNGVSEDQLNGEVNISYEKENGKFIKSLEVVFTSKKFLMNLKNVQKDMTKGFSYSFSRRLSDNKDICNTNGCGDNGGGGPGGQDNPAFEQNEEGEDGAQGGGGPDGPGGVQPLQLEEGRDELVRPGGMNMRKMCMILVAIIVIIVLAVLAGILGGVGPSSGWYDHHNGTGGGDGGPPGSHPGGWGNDTEGGSGDHNGGWDNTTGGPTSSGGWGNTTGGPTSSGGWGNHTDGGNTTNTPAPTFGGTTFPPTGQ